MQNLKKWNKPPRIRAGNLINPVGLLLQELPLPPTNAVHRDVLSGHTALSPASPAHISASPLGSPCDISVEPKLCTRQGRSPRVPSSPKASTAVEAPQAPQVSPWPWTAAPACPLSPVLQLPAWKSYLSEKETEKDRELGWGPGYPFVELLPH